MTKQLDLYVGNNMGDFVRCNNCDTIMLLPHGADKCPKCGTVGRLLWVDDNNQEQRWAELLKVGYHLRHSTTLKPERYLSDEGLTARQPKTVSTLEDILASSEKCEKFAEVILEEILSDEEQLLHIGSNIIKAYLDRNCDKLLIALCGWSMDSLLDKYHKAAARLYTCPECREKALRYAMINVDDTNLEEGYSCGECGTNFIGLDNQGVIELNPQITEENE